MVIGTRHYEFKGFGVEDVDVYMDDLSKKLNNVNAGCFMGTALINNLMYADDILILAPSHVGLSVLLSVCSDYGLEHDIKFNSAKSNIMIFCCKKFKDIHVPSFELNDNNYTAKS